MSSKKSYRVKSIFNKISTNYDFLNNLLSFGLHNLWKKKLVDLLQPKTGENWADLCCGTGDISILINKRVAPSGSIVGIDSAPEILEIAKLRSKNIPNKVISWEKKDIFDIDYSKQKFDGISMSYGLRNLNNVEKGIEKVFFMLNDNGRAGFLDFNHSRDKSLSDFFQKIYLRLIVVPIASLFNLEEEYSYIEKSIMNFPDGFGLVCIARRIGFRSVEYKTIFGGQMGILLLKK